MIIEIPDWCRIGEYIEWDAPHITDYRWVREKIVAFGYDGFFHQGEDCPIYFTKFSEFGKTVRLCKEKNTKVIYTEDYRDNKINYNILKNDVKIIN